MDIPQFTLLDGATATNLFARGLKDMGCIESEMLLNHNLLTTLQKEFITAGSDILYAPTFSANKAHLNEYNLGDKVDEINKKLVSYTKSIAKGKLVAGNLSPINQQIVDETSFNSVLKIYEEQAKSLFYADVDLFAIETMTSIEQARAAIFACKKYDKPVYLTFTINEKGKILSGASALTCLISTQNLGISAFGFNCSCGTNTMREYIAEIAPFAKVPLIAKPSAGMPNPLLPNVYDLSPIMMKEQMLSLLDAGATIIGGCCGTTPEHIAKMRELLDSYIKPQKQEKNEPISDIILSNSQTIFALDNDRIEFTEPVTCEIDMAQNLLSFEQDSFDVILIQLDTIDDALAFSENSHLAKLPICFYSTNEQALILALKLYNGRCMVDSQSPIEISVLQNIANQFGAVLY